MTDNNALTEFWDNLSPDVRAANPDLKPGAIRPAPAVIAEPGSNTKAAAPAPHKSTKVYSELIRRWFDSKAELRYCEMLWMRQLAGEIKCLEFQHEYVLSEKPKVTITVDAIYLEKTESGWTPVDIDVKGWKRTPKTKKLVPRIERDFRVKLIWLEQRYGIKVRMVR